MIQKNPSDADEQAEATRPGAAGLQKPRRWSRRTVAVPALAIGVVFVSLGVWLGLARSPTTGPAALSGPSGPIARAFSLQSLTEPTRDLSLATFRGRPLVVNFWSSWCLPCRSEMPLLEAASRSEGARVAFLGIDAHDTPAAARAFLAQAHVTYPTVSDSNGAVATSYGLYGLPDTVFISATGKVVGRHLGELDAGTLRTALREAFGA